MKKVVLILFLVLLTGCSKKMNSVTYGNNYYHIASPYKTGVSGNYVVNNMTNYDINEAESSLMEISSSYFYPETSYYQDGQYFEEEKLKEMLSKKELNNYEKITIDSVLIDPYYITSIVEQNYLDSENHLKGISLGLILNPYQSYKNSYGTILYKKIDEQKMLEIGKEITINLLKKIRLNETLSKTKIVIALYVSGNPLSNETGSYKKYGLTVNETIDFKDYEESEYYITSEYVMKNNNDIYSSFSNLDKKVRNMISKVYLMGTCKYKGDELKNITIQVNSSYLSKSELLAITQVLTDDIEANLKKNNILIYIKENNNIKAIIEKKINSKTNIHILEG